MTYEGETIAGMVSLASPKGTAIVVMFDGMFMGYDGAMPLSKDMEFDDDVYRDLMRSRQVEVALRDQPHGH